MPSVNGSTEDTRVYGDEDLPAFSVGLTESDWRARRADQLAEWALDAAQSDDPAVLARAQVWATLAGAEWTAAAHALEDDPTVPLIGIAEAIEGLRPCAPRWWRHVRATPRR